MKRDEDFEKHPFFLVAVRPGVDRSCRRWNLALIAALVFIVVGIFVMTMAPEMAATSQTHERPAPVQTQNGSRP